MPNGLLTGTGTVGYVPPGYRYNPILGLYEPLDARQGGDQESSGTGLLPQITKPNALAPQIGPSGGGGDDEGLSLGAVGTGPQGTHNPQAFDPNRSPMDLGPYALAAISPVTAAAFTFGNLGLGVNSNKAPGFIDFFSNLLDTFSDENTTGGGGAEEGAAGGTTDTTGGLGDPEGAGYSGFDAEGGFGGPGPGETSTGTSDGEGADDWHKGGPVTADGKPGLDRRAILQEGEFVINRRSAGLLGADFLNRLNKVGR